LWSRIATELRAAGLPVRAVDGAFEGLLSLHRAGCAAALIAVESAPGRATEFLCVWDASGVDPKRLNPLLLESANNWERQRARFGGMFVVETPHVDGGVQWREFAEVDQNGNARTVWFVDVVTL